MAVLQHEAFQQYLARLPNCHLIELASCKQQGTNKALEWPDMQVPTQVSEQQV